MAGDDFRFITQQTGRVPVYQLSEDSKYFVAFADVMHNDKRATAIDYQIALNDTSGSKVEGTHFDKDTGLLYIPKSAYYGADGKYYVQYIQTQILYSIKNYDIKNTWNSSVISTTEEENGETDSKISGADILNQRMSVQVGKNMDVNTMLVTANGFPVDGKLYAYNAKTGMLTLGFSSAVVQSIWVEAVKDENAPDEDMHSSQQSSYCTQTVQTRITGPESIREILSRHIVDSQAVILRMKITCCSTYIMETEQTHSSY